MQYRPRTTLAGLLAAVAVPVVGLLLLAAPLFTMGVAALAVAASVGTRRLVRRRARRRRRKRTRGRGAPGAEPRAEQ